MQSDSAEHAYRFLSPLEEKAQNSTPFLKKTTDLARSLRSMAGMNKQLLVVTVILLKTLDALVAHHETEDGDDFLRPPMFKLQHQAALQHFLQELTRRLETRKLSHSTQAATMVANLDPSVILTDPTAPLIRWTINTAIQEDKRAQYEGLTTAQQRDVSAALDEAQLVHTQLNEMLDADIRLLLTAPDRFDDGVFASIASLETATAQIRYCVQAFDCSTSIEKKHRIDGHYHHYFAVLRDNEDMLTSRHVFSLLSLADELLISAGHHYFDATRKAIQTSLRLKYKEHPDFLTIATAMDEASYTLAQVAAAMRAAEVQQISSTMDYNATTFTPQYIAKSFAPTTLHFNAQAGAATPRVSRHSHAHAGGVSAGTQSNSYAQAAGTTTTRKDSDKCTFFAGPRPGASKHELASYAELSEEFYDLQRGFLAPQQRGEDDTDSVRASLRVSSKYRETPLTAGRLGDRQGYQAQGGDRQGYQAHGARGRRQDSPSPRYQQRQAQGYDQDERGHGAARNQATRQHAQAPYQTVNRQGKAQVTLPQAGERTGTSNYAPASQQDQERSIAGTFAFRTWKGVNYFCTKCCKPATRSAKGIDHTYYTCKSPYADEDPHFHEVILPLYPGIHLDPTRVRNYRGMEIAQARAGQRAQPRQQHTHFTQYGYGNLNEVADDYIASLTEHRCLKSSDCLEKHRPSLYTGIPSQATQTYSLVPTLPNSPAFLDSGCAPDHVFPSDRASDVADGTPQTIFIDTPLAKRVSTQVIAGTGFLATLTNTGQPLHLALPGRTITGPDFQVTLISMQALLRGNWHIEIALDHALLTSPTGLVVKCPTQAGLYTFPTGSQPKLKPSSSSRVMTLAPTTSCVHDDVDDYVLPVRIPYFDSSSIQARQVRVQAWAQGHHKTSHSLTSTISWGTDPVARTRAASYNPITPWMRQRSPGASVLKLCPQVPVTKTDFAISALNSTFNTFQVPIDVTAPSHARCSTDPPVPSALLSATAPRKNTKAALIDASEPLALKSELDLIDTLHAAHGHPCQARLRSIILAMAPDDPARPNPRSLKQWAFFRKCAACSIGNITRPSQALAHPPTTIRRDATNGSHLSIDGLGAFLENDIDHHTTGWIFTDAASNYRLVFLVKDRSLDTLVVHLKTWIAQSGVKPQSIRVDNEMTKGSFNDYCRDQGIKLTACAPYTHQGNSIAENSVRLIKAAARITAHAAGTGTLLHGLCLQNACTAANRTPTSSDPSGQHRSPCMIWPTAPFCHSSQPLHPFGCYVVPWVGKVTSNPNMAARGREGVYVGHATNTSGYLVYHFDSNQVRTYNYLDAFPLKFPCKVRQLAGEHAGTLTDGAWRHCSHLRPGEVNDATLCEFAVGKQLHVTLPIELYPQYSHAWRAVAQRPIQLSSGLTGLRMVFTAYTGDQASLSPQDKLLLSHKLDSFIDIPISHVPMAARSNTTTLWKYDLRTLLEAEFPAAVALWQYAELNMRRTNVYPTSPAVDYNPVPLDIDDATVPHIPRAATKLPRSPAHGNHIVVPVRTVSGRRTAKAPWVPAVTHKVVQGRTSLPRAAKDAKPVRRLPSSRDRPKQIIMLTVTSPTDSNVRFEPKTVSEARAHSSWPHWEAAIDKEVSGLVGRHVWTAVTRGDVPAGVTIMGTQFILKRKATGEFKARLVVRGDQQRPKPLPEDTYASTPSAAEVRILFSTATQLRRPIHSCDIAQAFTQSDAFEPGEELYIYPPHGYSSDRDLVWKLVKPLYGLAVAPRRWANTLKTWLRDYGFVSINCSDTFLSWTNPLDSRDNIHLVFHVDDLLFSFNSDEVGKAFKLALLSRFAGTDDGPVRTFLGINVLRDADCTHLSQAPMIATLLDTTGMSTCNSVSTPMEPHTLLTAQSATDPEGPVDLHTYQRIVGTLLYLTTWTRPDLSFATNQLAKFMANPSVKHVTAAYRVLRYLKGTPTLGLTYTCSHIDPNRLIGFADADWAACTETRRSVSGYVGLLNGAAISWKSRQQKSVASSTSEAEFVSASRASDDILWIRRILEDMGLTQETPTPLFEDNRGCRMMSENPVANDRTKHIDYRVHSLRERVAAGIIRLVDCPTVDMVADPLTKNLPGPDFARHRDVQLGLKRHTAPALPKDLTKAGPRTCLPRVKPLRGK